MEGPGLKRGPRGDQGEVHLDLDGGIAEKETTNKPALNLEEYLLKGKLCVSRGGGPEP